MYDVYDGMNETVKLIIEDPAALANNDIIWKTALEVIQFHPNIRHFQK
jgi:hypothetical protein